MPSGDPTKQWQMPKMREGSDNRGTKSSGRVGGPAGDIVRKDHPPFVTLLPISEVISSAIGRGIATKGYGSITTNS